MNIFDQIKVHKVPEWIGNAPFKIKTCLQRPSILARKAINIGKESHQYWQGKPRILINFFVKEKLVEIVIKDPILHHLVLSLYIRGVYFLGIIVRKSLIDFSSLNCWKLLIFNYHNMTAVLNKITCPRLYHCAIQHIQFTILDRCSEPKKTVLD